MKDCLHLSEGKLLPRTAVLKATRSSLPSNGRDGVEQHRECDESERARCGTVAKKKGLMCEINRVVLLFTTD